MIEESLFLIIQSFYVHLNYDSKTNYEFQISNCNNIALTIRTLTNVQYAKEFIDQLTYFKINDNVIKNELMREKYFGKTIIRSAISFHQNDNNIRIELYKCILNNMNYVRHLYCIGGEMYLFGKILCDLYEYGYFYSDLESIVHDCHLNNNHPNNKIFLIDYTRIIENIFQNCICPIEENVFQNCTCPIENNFRNCSCLINNMKYVIINIGKIGIRKHLCDELTKSNFDKIFIISCHKKSFQRDYDMLKQVYEIHDKYTFTTNYTINLYILYKK